MWQDQLTKLGIKERLRLRCIEEMQETLQLTSTQLQGLALARLNDELEHAALHSPFYAARFKAGQLPKTIGALAELADVPFTTKNDLRQAYPFGLLAVSPASLIRYGESTGTTGTPTSSFITQEDWERSNVWCSLCYASFFTPEDLIFIALPYELAFAGIDIDRGLWDTGATIAAVGTLNMVCPWPRVVRMMANLRPSVLVCSPTRALRVYDLLLEAGYDPGQVPLRLLFYTGETCSNTKLAKIAKLWGIDILTAYGTTETNTLSLPCKHGYQHLSEDRYYFEVIDPDTAIPVAPGQRGELVITSLMSQAMPLIRYRTGDAVRVIPEPCLCGLPFRRLEHYGRFNESVVIGGRSVLKIDLEELILSTEGTGCYYAFEIEDSKLQVLIDATDRDADSVCRAVQDRLQRELCAKATVDVVGKQVFSQAMDTMLKPGSLSLRRIRELANEH